MGTLDERKMGKGIKVEKKEGENEDEEREEEGLITGTCACHGRVDHARRQTQHP